VTLAPGARLLQYEIVERLGAGGMGDVYRARDSRLGREVAIKVLSDHLASDPDMRARFEHEARAVAALSHPGILSIHELAQVGDQSVAVMELLQGESLRARLARGAMHWREAAEFGAQVAEALAVAHVRGIIHRDLKPENIFVMPDGRAKILDFGLARSKDPLFAADVDEQPTMMTTQVGRVFGTIGYMAPEQIRGEAADVPADIFALGCVLAELVTARRAFARPTPAASLAAILSEPPPDLTAVADLPPGYAAIVAHCLAKEPRARFQSAGDVAVALRSLASDPALATSGVLVAPAGKRRPSRGTRSLAVLPLSSGATDPGTEYLADGVTEGVINSLSQLPRLRVVPRSLAFRYKGREVDPRSVALALNARLLVTGRVAQHGDMLHAQVELIDADKESQLWGYQTKRPVADVLAVQEEIASRISEALSLRLSGDVRKRIRRRNTASGVAYQEYIRGRFHWSKWTAEDFRLAIQHFERAIHADPGFALAYSGLSDTYGAMGYYGYLPPEIAMPRAKAAATKALELDDSLAEAHTAIAIGFMMYSWRWEEADREFQRALELNPDYAATYTLYSLYHVAHGRFDRALALAQHASRLDPLSPLAQMSPAWVLYFARRYRDSIDHVRRLMSVNPNWAEARGIVMLGHEQLGELEQAAAFIEGSALFMGTSPDELESLRRAARDGHRAYWEVRLGLTERSSGHLPPYFLAIPHAQLGRTDEAFALLDRAVEGRNAQLVFAAVDPSLDPLRADPRFESLLKTIGLPVVQPVGS
jgi:serine/threonine protein kinase/tetratricopeptide (TPR) repeat protein